MWCLAVAAIALGGADSYGLGDGSDGSLVASGPGVFVNTWTGVSVAAAAGDSSVAVDDASAFSAGDLVLVWTAVDPGMVVVAGAPTPFDVEAAGGAGNLEWARITAIGGPVLSLDAPLLHDALADGTQVIRVPEYTTVDVPAGTSIAALPWDGRIGGLVAFVAQGTVTLAGDVTADGAGLPGGLPDGVPGDSCLVSGDPASGQNGTTLDGKPGGPGFDQVGTGGGGGGCAGGGGGGGGGWDSPDPFEAYGDGGQGGWSWTGEAGGGGRDVGGRGGDRGQYDPIDGRLAMGGGGGAGDDGGAGGAGGGVALIHALDVVGAGQVTASGAPGGDSLFSGGGGGGGGSVEIGTVGLCDFGGAAATGGDGGDAGTGYGPGGGGGGGEFTFVGMGLVGLCGTLGEYAVAGSWPDGTSWGAADGTYAGYGNSNVFVTDADFDGSYAEIDDCNDADADVGGNHAEVPGDGKDNDCDGVEQCWTDTDGDYSGEWPPIDSADFDFDDAGEAYALDDSCIGFDDRIDRDGDGWPDGCDPAPDGTAPPIDTASPSPPDSPGDTGAPASHPGDTGTPALAAPVAEGGGCGCAANGGRSSAGLVLAALVALRRRCRARTVGAKQRGFLLAVAVCSAGDRSGC